MYVDIDLIYALVRENERLREHAERVLSGRERQYTSAVALLELEIVVKRELSDELSKRVTEAVHAKLPRLTIKPFDSKIMAASLELRRRHGLGIFDAVHAATALAHDKRIASTDEAFDRVPALERIKG